MAQAVLVVLARAPRGLRSGCAPPPGPARPARRARRRPGSCAPALRARCARARARWRAGAAALRTGAAAADGWPRRSGPGARGPRRRSAGRCAIRAARVPSREVAGRARPPRPPPRRAAIARWTAQPSAITIAPARTTQTSPAGGKGRVGLPVRGSRGVLRPASGRIRPATSAALGRGDASGRSAWKRPRASTSRADSRGSAVWAAAAASRERQSAYELTRGTVASRRPRGQRRTFDRRPPVKLSFPLPASRVARRPRAPVGVGGTLPPPAGRQHRGNG